MNVQSVVGTWRRFEVWLPRIDASAPASDEETATPPFGHGETVLLVEPSSEQLLRDEEILAALGYEPVGFTRAELARAACEAEPERFDVLVVGHLFPTTAASELAKTMHRLAPGLPILVAISQADEFAAERLVAAGICSVVPWPIKVAEAATALHSCPRWRGPHDGRSLTLVHDDRLGCNSTSASRFI
jgi:DNA-binding NtrC family response regulator